MLLKKIKEEGIKTKKMYWGREIGARRYLVEYFLLLPFNKVRFFLILFFNKKWGCKNIVFFQSFNEKLFATGIAKFLGYKVFWIEHLSVGPWLTKNLLLRNYIKKSKKADKIITVSKLIKNEIVKDLKIDEKKIYIVYGGIDLEQFYPLESKIIEAKKKEFGFYKESRIIGFVGRLHSEKGVDVLIKAFAELVKRFDPIYLLIIGEGPEQKPLEELTKRLALEKKILFLGYREDVSVLVNMMDVLVLPSVVRESLGIVLLEAMAAAKVVVASNLGGIPEIIKDKENGFLFEPGDVKQLSDIMSHVLSDKNFRGEIENNALRSVRTFFSKEAMVKSIERIISK